MAGDWIKLRTDLQTDPAVIRLGSILGLDTFAIIGRLAAVWVWADTHADRHGCVTLVSRSCLDALTHCEGFGAALESVGWLKSSADEGGGISFPRFDRHMGEGAKARAQAAKRKQKQRSQASRSCHAPVTQTSRSHRDTTVTREEKRREEKKEEEPPSEVCSEPLAAASEPAILTAPTTGERKEWILTPAKLAEWEATFPTLDVLAALRAAVQWCRDNPTRRKTARGMPSFCSKWLNTSVNRGQFLRAAPTAPTPPTPPKPKETILERTRRYAGLPPDTTDSHPGVDPCLPRPTGTFDGSLTTSPPSAPATT